MIRVKEFLVNLFEPFYLDVFMPWFERSGFILYGGGGGTPKPAKPVPEVQFQPYTLTTSTGTTTGTKTPGGGFEVGVGLDPTISALGEAGYAGALGLQPELLAAIKDRPGAFSFDYDPRAAASEYYTEQAALLEPQFAQQRQALKNDLFGSGRMGLSLAGESMGAGAGSGMVSPDAFGLGQAQSQTLAGISAGARERALAEQQGLFALESGAYGLNQGAQQQYLQNLLGGSVGLMGQGAGVSELEQSLIAQGVGIEDVRSGAHAASALAGAQLRPPVKQESGGGGLFGSLVGAFLDPVGTAAGTAFGGIFK